MQPIAKQPKRRRSILLACSAISATAWPIAAQSQSTQSTWTSGTSGNWSETSNWTPAAAPLSQTSTRLTFGGSTTYTATNDIGVDTFTLNGITVSNTGATTLAGAAAANTITFAGTAPTLFVSAGSGATTISNSLVHTASTRVTNNSAGVLLLGGGQAFTNGAKQTFINNGSGTLSLADNVTYAATGTNTGVVLNVINNNTTSNTFNVGDLGGLDNFTLHVGGTGTVRWAPGVGGTEGDLFSDSGILHVAAGATFNFNNNGEAMGGIRGAGNIAMGNAGITTSAAGYFAFSGRISGTGAMASSGASNILVLSNSTNSYTGTTTVAGGGTLIASANNAFGSATTSVLVGSTSGSTAATLLIDTAAVTIARNIELRSGGTGTLTVGGINTTGTTTYSGNVSFGTPSAAARPLTVVANAGGAVAFTGNLVRPTGATGTTDTLTKIGGGTVILSGANTFTGSTTVRGGVLQLNYAANNSAKIASDVELVLAGGSLEVIGSNAAATIQSVTGLTLGVATPAAATPSLGGNIAVTSGNNQNATLSLGAITRNTGATIDFTTVSTGTGIASIASTAPNTADIIGGFATYNKSGWATNNGSDVLAPLASYSASFVSGQNTTINANQALPGGGATTNSLRITGASTLSFNATTPGTLTLESGGLLIAADTGAVTIGSTTTRGTLAANGSELFIHTHGSGAVTVNSVITGTNLVKNGQGTLSLTAVNTHTGINYVNGGTLIVNGATSLGAATADVVLNGATLRFAAAGGTFNSTNRQVTIGQGGAVLDFSVNQTFNGNALLGSGHLTKAGTGQWSVGSNASGFSGHLLISAGTLLLTSSQLDSVASVTVESGAAYEVNDDVTDTFTTAASGRFVLNGTGPSGNGALRLTDQTPGTAGAADPTTTIDREVVLASDSRIQTENGSATGSLSTFILTGNVTGPGSLEKTGNGLLILTARDNSYAGATKIVNGTLRTNLGDDRLPTTTSVTLGGGTTSGTLSLNGFSQEIAGLTTAGAGASNRVVGGSTSQSTLHVNASADQTFSGFLGGAGADEDNLKLIKSGNSTLTLTAASTYTGGTLVSAGKLLVNNSTGSGTGTGDVVVSGTGSTVGGSGTIAGKLTIASAGTIAPGNSVGTLTSSGGQEWQGGGSYVWEIDNPDGTAGGTGWDLAEVGPGTLTISANPSSPFTVAVTRTGTAASTSLDPEAWYTIAHANLVTDASNTPLVSLAGLFSLPTDAQGTDWEIQVVAASGGGFNVQVSPVPEPSTLGLAALGAVGLLRRRRRN